MSDEPIKPPNMAGSIKGLGMLQQLADSQGWMLTAAEAAQARALRDLVLQRIAARNSAPKPGPARHVDVRM